MRPIQRNEVLPIGDYEAVRPPFRARVLAEKQPRRFALGPHMSGVFENRDTVLLQIQEMLRTERITSEDGIRHEIETYNELVPGPCELSMTCFVEIPDRALRDEMLAKLAGLEAAFAVEVDGRTFAASGPRDAEASPHRTTAVHYLKARLSPEARDAVLARRARVAIVVRHPAYEARADLGEAALGALATDLAAS
jgi:hypothetical protein